jgi:hypothetical protein
MTHAGHNQINPHARVALDSKTLTYFGQSMWDGQGIGTDEPSPQAPPSILVDT